MVGLYPAAENIYTFEAQPEEDRESFKILIDISDEVNSWGVSPHIPTFFRRGNWGKGRDRRREYVSPPPNN